MNVSNEICGRLGKTVEPAHHDKVVRPYAVEYELVPDIDVRW